jgi:cytochrome c553
MFSRWSIVVKSLAFLSMFAPAAYAAGDAEKGMQLYTACASCHGGDGRSTAMPQYPKIGGQNHTYIVNAMKAYRDGRRQGAYAAIMSEAVKTLTDEHIAYVSVYVSTLPGP